MGAISRKLHGWCKDSLGLIGFADSDWAGDRADLKSTSGGAIMWGSHCFKTWSTSQTAVALSSGEAELCAMTKMAVQLSGLISLANDFNFKLTAVVRSDSNAAIGIAHRNGLGGRCRHIKVQYLWIQEKVKNGELQMKKVIGKDNPSDIMTKAVSQEVLQRHLATLNIEAAEGRAEKSSRLLHSMTPSVVRPRSWGGAGIHLYS